MIIKGNEGLGCVIWTLGSLDPLFMQPDIN